MSFSNRVASIATLTFAALAAFGISSPGFAQNIDRAINAPVASQVPPVAARVAAIADADSAAQAPASDDLQDGDTVEYGSLAAAVAGQADSDAMSADLACMAGAVYFESKGEPLAGQLAVAEVILNRAKSGRFPKSVCSVVTQPGQFSFVRGGRVPAVAQNRQYRTAVAVARVALADAWDSPASGAMYFHARRVAPSWNRVQVAAIGNHLFYR